MIKYFVLFVLLLFQLNIVRAQKQDTISNFNWTLDLYYSLEYRSEHFELIYKKGKYILNHKKFKTYHISLLNKNFDFDLRTLNTKKKLPRKKNKHELMNVSQFIQDINKKSRKVVLTDSDKTKILKMHHNLSLKYKENYPLYSIDVSKELMDTITIKFSYFQTDYNIQKDTTTFVLDGWDFATTLKINSEDNKKKQYRYSSNFDYVPESLLHYYFAYENLVDTKSFINNTNFKYYFNKNNIYIMVLKYISYKENIYPLEFWDGY